MDDWSLRKRLSRAPAQPNLVDRVIGYFDPLRAQQRLHARTMMAFGGEGGFIGASRGRRALSDWRTPLNASADADLLPALSLLRSRSRDLVRNNPIAGGAVNTVVTSVIGTGLMLQSQVDREVLRMSEEQAAAFQRAAEREFELFCNDCDASRTQNFYEMQDLVFRSTLESGDIFALMPYIERPGTPYQLKIQLIEADRVNNPNSKQDTNLLAGGVELDSYGAPIAYHLQKQHPGALPRILNEWQRIPAFGAESGRRNMLHVFKRLRPGQTRGQPYLAPVIETLKQLGRYTEAELMAAVVSGMFTVFVKSEGAGLDLANTAGMGHETGARPSDTDAKLGYGAMIDLAPDESIETANPGRPNAGFDPFVVAILRQIGVRLELPFELLIKHFTSSYSASRAALLEAWRFFKVQRMWVAGKFCQPVYEMVLEEAIAIGRLSAPGFFADPLIRAAYCGSQWYGDGAGSIDPASEAGAAKTRMDIGLTTLKMETAEFNGGIWERNHEQQTKERAMRKEAGLTVEGVAKATQQNELPPKDTRTP